MSATRTDRTPDPTFRPGVEATRSTRKNDPSRKRNERPRLGLCASCAIYERCTLPKPEGYVWHCEEYV
jgi:hypothetical protein